MVATPRSETTSFSVTGVSGLYAPNVSKSSTKRVVFWSYYATGALASFLTESSQGHDNPVDPVSNLASLE